MNQFHTADEEFDLLPRYGFVPLYAFWSNNFIIYTKILDPINNVYAFLFVSTNSSGGIIVDLWVSPICYPDSRLDVNSAAFKIFIAETWDEDNDFLKKCQRRIINLLPGISNLSTSVLSEINTPSLITKGHQITHANYPYILKTLYLIKANNRYDNLNKIIEKFVKGNKNNISSLTKHVSKVLECIRESTDDLEYKAFMDKSLHFVLPLSETITACLYIETCVGQIKHHEIY